MSFPLVTHPNGHLWLLYPPKRCALQQILNTFFPSKKSFNSHVKYLPCGLHQKDLQKSERGFNHTIKNLVFHLNSIKFTLEVSDRVSLSSLGASVDCLLLSKVSSSSSVDLSDIIFGLFFTFSILKRKELNVKDKQVIQKFSTKIFLLVSWVYHEVHSLQRFRKKWLLKTSSQLEVVSFLFYKKMFLVLPWTQKEKKTDCFLLWYTCGKVGILALVYLMRKESRKEGMEVALNFSHFPVYITFQFCLYF